MAPGMKTLTSDNVIRLAAFLLVPTLLIVGYYPSLDCSLWLDETLTYWASHEGAALAIERSSKYLGQSPLYFLIEWSWCSIFGWSESSMRIPSLMFVVLTAVVVWRLGSLWMGERFGEIAALCFILNSRVMGVAVSARPYALALLTSTAAIFYLESFITNGRRNNLYKYILCSVAMVWAHFFFAVTFAVHACVLIRHRSNLHGQQRSLILAAIGIAIGCLPIMPQLIGLRNQTFKSFADMPTIGQLADSLDLPLFLLAMIGVGACISLFLRIRSTNRIRLALRSEYLAALVWWIAPPLAMYSLSHITNTSVFVSNYFLASVVGQSLLVACFLRLLLPVGWSYKGFVAAPLYILLTFLIWGIPVGSYIREDWREASSLLDLKARENTNLTTLYYSGHVELRYIGFLTDREKIAVMLSPLTKYPIGGKIVLLPPNVRSEELRAYTMDKLAALSSEQEIGLLYRDWEFDSFESIKLYLEGMGFRYELLHPNVGELQGVKAGLFRKVQAFPPLTNLVGN